MSEYATKGAQLKCSCGGAPSILSVSSNTSFMVQNNAVATTADKAPFINIKPFGPCSLRMGYPCTPYMDWFFEFGRAECWESPSANVQNTLRYGWVH